MATLHIEHAVTDYAGWKRAFDGFAELRRNAGVRGHVIRRPVDDPNYIVADLEFDTEQAAESFREILRTRIWGIASNSPALVGEPSARVLLTEESSAAGEES